MQLIFGQPRAVVAHDDGLLRRVGQDVDATGFGKAGIFDAPARDRIVGVLDQFANRHDRRGIQMLGQYIEQAIQMHLGGLQYRGLLGQ